MNKPASSTSGAVTLKKAEASIVEKAFGLWNIKETGLEYERRMRNEWKDR